MATINRAQLNQSNQVNINGFGKVTKTRHSIHNNNIADYVDTKDATMQSLLASQINSVLSEIGLVEDQIASITSGIMPAELTTNPAANPAINAYFLVGGAGSYTNILTAVSTPMTLSAPEAAEGLWMAYKKSDGYWGKALVLVFKASENLEIDNKSDAVSGYAVSNFIDETIASGISFDGENMIYSPEGGVEKYSLLYQSSFLDWTYYAVPPAVAGSGTDGTGSWAYLKDTIALCYKDGLFDEGDKLKIVINIDSNTSGGIRFQIDDSADPVFGLNVVLPVGVSTVYYDSTGRPDTTMILSQTSSGDAYIRSISIYKQEIVDNVKTPLNIESSPLSSLLYINTNNFTNHLNTHSSNNVTRGLTGKNLTVSATGFPALNTAYVVNNKAVLQENNDVSYTYFENAPSYTDFGFWSTNAQGYKHTVAVRYHTVAGSEFGKLAIRANLSGGYIFTDKINTDYTLGDILTLTVQRRGIDYIFKVKNETKGWLLVHIEPTTPTSVPFPAHNTSKCGVMLYDGSITVISERYTVFKYENIDNIIVGDSITYGSDATVVESRYASLVNGATIVSGGGADYTASVLERVNEIIALKPRRVLLMIGGNDILFGIPSGTWQSNYKAIRSAIVSAGIQFVHLLPTARSGASTLVNFINTDAAFAGDLKIDCNTPTMLGNANTLNPAYDSGDALHPNNAGHFVVANTINAALGI